VTSERVPASTATIKFGKGFEDPWYVVYGSPEEIREQLVVAFGYDRASVATLSLAELIVESSRRAQVLRTASISLGGEIVAVETAKAAPAPRRSRAAAKPADDAIEGTPAKVDTPAIASPPDVDPPWDDPEATDPLIAQIEAVTTKAEFALLWKANQARFSEPAVKAAAAAAQGRLQ